MRPTFEAVVAIDVGGTTVKGWRCDAAGTVTDVRRLATPDDAPQIVDAVRSIAGELASDAGAVGAAVVVPGEVDESQGVVRWSANLRWQDVPLRALLQSDLGLPVAVGHDVRAAAGAELMFGAARGASDALVLVIGTGIAAAVIADGRVVSGATGMAGEIGHLPVVAPGEVCGCGGSGCTEVYASATGIASRYAAVAGVPRSAAEIADRLVEDPVAAKVWSEAVDALGRALVAATVVTDPERIVVGGGHGAAGDRLLDPLRARIAETLPPGRRAPVVAEASLGPDAGCVGAAVLAWRAAGEEVPSPMTPATAEQGDP